MMSAMFAMILLAGVIGVVVVVVLIILATRSGRSRELPTGVPQPRELMADQLAHLDRRLAAGELSQADYATQRNRLLGLPEPDQR